MIAMVRHPPVTLTWQKRCYGISDPGLSRAGRGMVAALVERLAALRPGHIIHSDMQRTRAVAVPLGQILDIEPQAEPLWRERDFGSWEGLGWNAIYRATGNAMDGMIEAPETFRPGGDGETTRELMERARAAWARLPAKGRIVVITHGGPIACARAARLGQGLSALAGLVPAAGSVTLL